MTYRLEPLTIADAAFRWEVYDAAIKHWVDQLLDLNEEQQREIISGQLAAGQHAAIVVNDVRVGVLQVEETDAVISLSQIELLPAYQGLGIGSAVLETVVERARRVGKPLILHVFQGNTRARTLYERFGFRVVNETAHDFEMRREPGCPLPSHR